MYPDLTVHFRPSGVEVEGALATFKMAADGTIELTEHGPQQNITVVTDTPDVNTYAKSRGVDRGQAYASNREHAPEPYRFLEENEYRVLNESDRPYLKLRRLIQLAVGAASMTWPEVRGIFDTEKAGTICDEVLSYIFDMILPEMVQERVDKETDKVRFDSDPGPARFEVELNPTGFEVSANGVKLGRLARVQNTDVWTTAPAGPLRRSGTGMMALSDAVERMIDQSLPLGVDKRGMGDTRITFREPTLYVPTKDEDDEEDETELL